MGLGFDPEAEFGGGGMADANLGLGFGGAGEGVADALAANDGEIVARRLAVSNGGGFCRIRTGVGVG